MAAKAYAILAHRLVHAILPSAGDEDRAISLEQRARIHDVVSRQPFCVACRNRSHTLAVLAKERGPIDHSVGRAVLDAAAHHTVRLALRLDERTGPPRG